MLPPDWEEFKLHYRYRERFHHITVRRDLDNPERSDPARRPKVLRVVLEGEPQPDIALQFKDDPQDPQVEVVWTERRQWRRNSKPARHRKTHTRPGAANA